MKKPKTTKTTTTKKTAKTKPVKPAKAESMVGLVRELYPVHTPRKRLAQTRTARRDNLAGTGRRSSMTDKELLEGTHGVEDFTVPPDKRVHAKDSCLTVGYAPVTRRPLK
jgi:hypothetical protein